MIMDEIAMLVTTHAIIMIGLGLSAYCIVRLGF